jgi:hypothetical protein
MTRSDLGDPIDRHIAEQAEIILGPLDLADGEINDIIEEWCSHDIEYGHVTRMLAKLQRIAFEYILRRDGLYSNYRDQKDFREIPEEWMAVHKELRK